jgi:hypothetical protein
MHSRTLCRERLASIRRLSYAALDPWPPSRLNTVERRRKPLGRFMGEIVERQGRGRTQARHSGRVRMREMFEFMTSTGVRRRIAGRIEFSNS